MTTEDNRPRAAGGYSDSGQGDFDEAGYSSDRTTVLPGSTAFDDDFGDDFGEDVVKPPVQWHGGLDFGLLVLRVVLGGMFVAHGLDQLFGWFDGLGRSGTEELLAGFGFTEPAILTWVLSISQIVGGGLLVLGLFTPLGAAIVLAVMANVIIVKGEWDRFGGGVELEIMYAASAFALLFTGAGRVAIDRNTHWLRKAPAYGFVFLLVAAGAAAVTLLAFR